jgi:hypothetical protein
LTSGTTMRGAGHRKRCHQPHGQRWLWEHWPHTHCPVPSHRRQQPGCRPNPLGLPRHTGRRTTAASDWTVHRTLADGGMHIFVKTPDRARPSRLPKHRTVWFLNENDRWGSKGGGAGTISRNHMQRSVASRRHHSGAKQALHRKHKQA